MKTRHAGQGTGCARPDAVGLAPPRTLLRLALVPLMLFPIVSLASEPPREPARAVGPPPSAVAEDPDPQPVGATEHYPRATYVWPYAQGPYYGEVPQTSKRTAGVVVTRVGSFRLDGRRLPIPDELTTKPGATRYFAIASDPTTVDAKSLTALRAVIESTGGAVLRHLPVSVTLARLSPEGTRAVRDAPGVVAVEPYHAAWKLDPTIGRIPHPVPERALADEYDLDVVLFRGEAPERAARRVQAIGATVSRTFSDRLVVTLHRSKLAELARIDGVEAVFEHRPVLLQGQETTNAIQTGGIRLDTNPYHEAGIRGRFQILGVIDNGLQLDAADLSDTATSPGTPGPGHRKVLSYETAGISGGSGDLMGCDAPPQGGYTHGHVVTATAIGNAEHESQRFRGQDAHGNFWSLSGVAPDAVVAFVDAQITPPGGPCEDPVHTLQGGDASPPGVLDVGDLHDPLGGAGALDVLYGHGARVLNLSFGDAANTYGVLATDVDDFLAAHENAAVTIAVGNNGDDRVNDGMPDPGSVNDVATSKNGIVVGAHGAPDDDNLPANIDERATFSGVGPAGSSARIAPLLLAPGQERGMTGLASEYACRSPDNDNDGAVSCDVVTGRSGTSYASAAAAGAALLVRDWFAQGFHPDATATNPGNAADRIGDVSGALVKAVLIASAEFVGRDISGQVPIGIDNVSRHERFNNEQGYGRIQLDNVLPLESWPATPDALLAVDGALVTSELSDFGGTLTGRIDAAGGEIQTAGFDVCNDAQELRVALAWTEEAGDALLNDLDLELISPSGRVYYGNYFTEDDDRDGVLAPGEDCPARFDDREPPVRFGLFGDASIDRSRWSLETCERSDGTVSPHDTQNPTEAIFLSPNPQGDVDASGAGILRGGACSSSGLPCGSDAHCAAAETCVGGTSQVEAGGWTVRVVARQGGTDALQGYALVVAGGVCTSSSVRLDRTSYACTQEVEIAIQERGEPADPGEGLDAAEIASRLTLEVLDARRRVVDSEPGSGLVVTAPSGSGLRFLARGAAVSGRTGRAPGNGVLDARTGETIRAVYADEAGGIADPARRRTSSATVDCRPRIRGGLVTFPQFGRDASHLITGGCERNARGRFEFGFPDRYMDAGETLGYRVAIASVEDEDLPDAEAELRCVLVDADSPEDCRPDSDDCIDPRRENNQPCAFLHVVDSPKSMGLLPGRSATAVAFVVQVDESLTGTPDIEMVLTIRAPSSGHDDGAVIVERHRLNVDEYSRFYSTDFPHGGVEILDRDNNGLIENPRTTGPSGAPTAGNTDYFFETRVYGDLTACLNSAGKPGPCNDGLQSPWNFDTGDGGFRSGLHADSDVWGIAETIANWGEDMNFNGTLDGRCASAPEVACARFPQDPLSCGAGGDFTCVSTEDRDPVNLVLDQNWSTNGGCGWQTKAPGTCSGDALVGCYSDADCNGAGSCAGPAQEFGGVWHTGRIGRPDIEDCLTAGNQPGACQIFETVGGILGRYVWWEMLLTPVIEKVDQSLDATGRPRSTVEILDWAFNAAVDLPDNNVSFNYRFDTDVDRLEPSDPVTDRFQDSIWNAIGEFGAVRGRGNPFLTRGWGMFAPLDPASGETRNGTAGGSRRAQNGCFFEGGAVDPADLELVGLPGPPDDDAPEGFCPSGQSPVTGMDPHLRYCTTVCADAEDVPCGTDEDCRGICLNSGLQGFCSNEPARPCIDDAACRLGGCVDVLCNGTCDALVCSTSGVPCSTDADCAQSCIFTQNSIDTFVTASGPVRNIEANDFNGPDMRYVTFEDRYGPTGNRFQGALGFRTREAIRPPEAVAGYGLAVDDMVVAWREFTLEEDVTDCRLSGACAVLEVDTTTAFTGIFRLGLTVADPTPGDNDCDLDGVGDGRRDCDGDGVEDVAVRVTSPQEPAGEVVILPRIASGVFRGSVAVSSAYDLEGTLFVAPVPANPVVEAVYFDLDDGTGRPCGNRTEPTEWGRVTASTRLVLEEAPLTITRVRLTDNGDHDGWLDSGESALLAVEAWNKSDAPITNLKIQAATSDPKIDCIERASFRFGDLAPGERRFGTGGLVVVLSQTAQRDSVDEDFTVTFDLTAVADQFAGLAMERSVTLDLDLDATGGGEPTTFLDSFETGELGAFEPMEIDRDLNPPDDDLGNRPLGVLNADGYRCQYSDPDWEGSVSHNSSQAAVCFPNPNETGDNFFWTTTTERAFGGARALYYGRFIDESLGYSTPTAQLEAVRLTEPLNLGWAPACELDRNIPCVDATDCPQGQACVAASPTLSFKHQVSRLDHRSVGATARRGPDRGIVQVQLADESGEPVGHWVKLHAYVNTYDSQANANYFNCSFDPIDDGNTEEDFFDPADPDRLFGPSSTCSPEFNYVDQGSTVDRPDYIGDAPDGPALRGSGPGNWVEPVFDLDRYRGRRLRLRFLTTSLKLGSFLLWENAFVFNPDPRDDGWFIDDVTVTDVLTQPGILAADTKDPTALPGCSTAICPVFGLDVTCDGAPTVNGVCPQRQLLGSPVELRGTVTDETCPDGVVQYRFRIDVDRDGATRSPEDVLLQDWSEDDRVRVAPPGSTAYLVDVRCPTRRACNDTREVLVETACPVAPGGPGPASDAADPFLAANPAARRDLRVVRAHPPAVDTLVWEFSATVDVIRGSLDALRAAAGFGGTVETCVVDNGFDRFSVEIPASPPPGAGWYYVARSAESCNLAAGGSWGGVGEQVDRDAAIGAELASCGD